MNELRVANVLINHLSRNYHTSHVRELLERWQKHSMIITRENNYISVIVIIIKIDNTVECASNNRSSPILGEILIKDSVISMYLHNTSNK